VLPVVVLVICGFRKVAETFKQSARIVSVFGVAEVSVVLLLYCVSGPAVILLNKHIMKDYGFHFPILLASLGNILLMAATRIAVALGWKKLEIDHLGWKQYFKVIVPMNMLNFLSQALGMAAYEFISVPEIQIMKNVTIVMVLLFAWLLANEEVNRTLICSIILIAVGACLSAIQDSGAEVGANSTSRTLIGVALMVLASTSEAAKTVMSQLLVRSMPLFDGIYHSGPSFVIFAILATSFTEGEGLARFAYTRALLGCVVASALTTGVVVLSGFWLVRLMGAVTLKVLTQARSVGLVLCSVLFFGEFCTGPQYLCYTVTLIGMGLYDHAKQMLKHAPGGDAANVSGGAGPQGNPEDTLERPQEAADLRPPVALVHLALCAGYTLFGGGAIVGKLGVAGSNPVIFELAREVVSACLLFGAVCLTRQAPLPEREDAPRILLGGLSFFTNQIAWFVGLKMADPVAGSAWQTFLPILTTALSMAMGQSKIQAMQALGITVATGGAILMVMLDSSSGHIVDPERHNSTRFVSNVIFFMGILGTSIYFLVNSSLGSKYSACATVMWSNMVGSALLLLAECLALCCAPLMSLLCHSENATLQAQCLAQGFTIPSALLGPLAYEVVICTLVAWPLISWANQNTDPSVTSVYIGMHPVASTILSAVLVCRYGIEWGLRYDMTLPSYKDFGILLIICGLLITFRSDRASRERPGTTSSSK
jgi:drug/metabolite transporter (DMT)-like permease